MAVPALIAILSLLDSHSGLSAGLKTRVGARTEAATGLEVGKGVGARVGGAAEAGAVARGGAGARTEQAPSTGKLSLSRWRAARRPLDGDAGAVVGETVSAVPGAATTGTTTSHQVVPEEAEGAALSSVSVVTVEAGEGEGGGGNWAREAWLQEPLRSSLKEALSEFEFELDLDDAATWDRAGEGEGEVGAPAWLGGTGGQRRLREPSLENLEDRPRCFLDKEDSERCHANVYFFGVSKCGE